MVEVVTKYKCPWFLRNPHFNTLFPIFFRREAKIDYIKERIRTPDEDFLDIDWAMVEADKEIKKLTIISHGLEDSSSSIYASNMAKHLNAVGFDCACWNMRGCSGELNKKHHSYHSGKSEDLKAVIDHVIAKGIYEEIYLLGFSIGGNITLKYLGEDEVAEQIKKAICFSVPTDLECSSKQLAMKENRVYMQNFLRQFKVKLSAKAELFPEQISLDGFDEINNFLKYDGAYTAPLNGFEDAYDYWAKASSKNLIKNIQVPTLIISSEDDTFIGAACYPSHEAETNPFVDLEMPKYGGHLGFVEFNREGLYYHERRTLEWFNSSN